MAAPSVRVTVDILAFAVHEGGLEILLVKRKYDPFKSSWALPGGFITEKDETLDAAAQRELVEETNVSNVYLEQLYSFGDKGRDPRGRVVTVSYLALLQEEELEIKASSDASGVAWWPVKELPALAFDHAAIIAYGLKRLKYKIEYTPAAFSLLPTKFTLRDLQIVYEAILGHEIDNRNFRKKFLGAGILRQLDETSQETSFRPARLYEFSEQDFEKLPDRPVFIF
ncbi:MAG: NUDIX domain-containing protein [Candidatus Melainabacteria bacterium]|nr:NUDIX domain-containing protein [Candidatus Melainabacteria bacterium]